MKTPLTSQPVGLKKYMKKILCHHKGKKYFSKNRRKLCIFHFFDYLCEKIKN